MNLGKIIGTDESKNDSVRKGRNRMPRAEKYAFLRSVMEKYGEMLEEKAEEVEKVTISTLDKTKNT